jgi:hypothetical protein
MRTVPPADLTLSLDVIYHLIEASVFAAALRTLFAWSNRFVIIYASNLDSTWSSAHVRHRRFTDLIAETEPDWRLLAHLPNPYPYPIFITFFAPHRNELPKTSGIPPIVSGKSL